jgi:hypothetical protein
MLAMALHRKNWRSVKHLQKAFHDVVHRYHALSARRKMSINSANYQLSASELLLLDSSDDDYYGLWEIPIEFFQALTDQDQPSDNDCDACRERLVQHLSKVFEKLLDHGLIALYCGTCFQGEQKVLPEAEAKEAIACVNNYDYKDVPAKHVRLITTALGKERLSMQGYPNNSVVSDLIATELGELK